MGSEAGGVAICDDLKKFIMFQDLGAEFLGELADCVIVRKISPDTVLFHRGDPPTGFVLIKSGRVKLYCQGQDGQEQILHFFEAGDSFAEAALFLPGYPATARTMTDSELIFVPKDRFQQLLSSNSELALRMIAGLAVKQKRFLNRIEDLTLRDARGRLCHYLSNLLEETVPVQQKVQLPVTQGALAQLLGVTEETMSRTIRSLRKDGLLVAGGKGWFEIADTAKLKEAYAI